MTIEEYLKSKGQWTPLDQFSQDFTGPLMILIILVVIVLVIYSLTRKRHAYYSGGSAVEVTEISPDPNGDASASAYVYYLPPDEVEVTNAVAKPGDFQERVSNFALNEQARAMGQLMDRGQPNALPDPAGDPYFIGEVYPQHVYREVR